MVKVGSGFVEEVGCTMVSMYGQIWVCGGGWWRDDARWWWCLFGLNLWRLVVAEFMEVGLEKGKKEGDGSTLINITKQV